MTLERVLNYSVPWFAHSLTADNNTIFFMGQLKIVKGLEQSWPHSEHSRNNSNCWLPTQAMRFPRNLSLWNGKEEPEFRRQVKVSTEMLWWLTGSRHKGQGVEIFLLWETGEESNAKNGIYEWVRLLWRGKEFSLEMFISEASKLYDNSG